MIFSEKHIKQILEGAKTQTRRESDRYQIGRTYSIQPGRTKPGIKEGRILILDKRRETLHLVISFDDAQAEGGYRVIEYEHLYAQLHKFWTVRWAYTFKFVETH